MSYDVQLSVDAKHKLILDHEVTNSVTDRHLLRCMAIRAKDLLGVDQLQVLANMGYYQGKEVKACLQHGILPLIPQVPHLRRLQTWAFQQGSLPQ